MLAPAKVIDTPSLTNTGGHKDTNPSSRRRYCRWSSSWFLYIKHASGDRW